MCIRDSSGLIAILDGDTYNYSIELFEAKFPLRCNQYKLNTDAGVGHGEYRGGFGLLREYEILNNDTYTYCNIGRSIAKPWGINGANEGTNNYMIITSNEEEKRVTRIPSTKLKKGDTLKIVTGSGGGFGNPIQRKRENILADIENDFISKDVAQKVYNFK